MARPTVAFVTTPEVSHFARLMGPIAGVVDAGGEAVVFTEAKFRGAVEGCGGTFRDLFGRWPIELVDGESLPRGCQQVSYAGWFAEVVAAELATVQPAVVVYDSFSVVSPLAARLLDLPYVCVCAGHNPNPRRFEEEIRRDVAVKISERCTEAVVRLRERYGMADSSPYSYIGNRSPWLNLYCEPEEYLDADVREQLAPVAFFGSLGPMEPPRRSTGLFGDGADGARRVYVSFGTVVWRYYPDAAVAALRVIVAALSRRGDVRVVVSLGGYTGEVPDLAAPGVLVVPYVDQWQVLGEADVFITHNGLNSTHEATSLGVPMLSYPFFWDQPALAAKCAELGIAVPLGDGPRPSITPDDVDRALARIDEHPERLRARLAEASAWERRVLEGQSAVIRQIFDLASG